MFYSEPDSWRALVVTVMPLRFQDVGSEPAKLWLGPKFTV